MTRGPELVSHLRTALVTQGFAMFDGVTDAATFADLARSVAAIVPHRDSGTDGVTVIADSGERLHRQGYAGFSNRALLPHTDGSGVPHPPKLLFMVCQQQAAEGGECLLVDGRDVHHELAMTNPDALRALSTPRSALFGGASGQLSSIFTHEHDRVRLRLRLDDLAQFSPEVTRHLPFLRRAIENHTITIKLHQGQGYALDNHRWIHARCGFVGHRVMYRLIGNPVSTFVMKSGFPPPTANHAPTGQAMQTMPAQGGSL